ncbi:hypothetical protein HNQ87_003019 [Pacificimonas flava]|uniref:Uncharacterized protein n=1 Tax=Pacificimonas flava TaxID=1234595 RepID=M2S889_9SPHN|nr:hypothetical protein C725_3003 [Pacificimonas flava]MBB5281831.1 hypothetical protein [Pacificimonas flava]
MDPRHRPGDLFALDALVDVDRQRFAGERIDDRQRPQAPPVEQRVRDEVHRPHLVRRRRRGLAFAVRSADAKTWVLEEQWKENLRLYNEAYMARLDRREDALHRVWVTAGERHNESFNGSPRHDRLNGEIFYSLAGAEVLIET